MPRNGSGTYNLPAGNPVSPNTTIQSTWANTTLQDIATALSGSLAADGQKTPTANLPMGSFKHTGVANATARTHYAAAGQVQDFAFSWCGAAGGTADAISLSPAVGISAYAAGQTFWFIPSGANTGAVTVSVSGLTTKALTKNGTTALSAGDLATNRIYSIVYDGTRFQLQSDPLGTYAPLDSPAFTGTPTAPTAALGTNTTQLATTAFVQSTLAGGVVVRSFSNLSASATGTNASVTVTADEVSLENSSNAYVTMRSVSLTINSQGSGANGLDTGSLAADTWYAVYVIYNPTTVTTAGLISTSATAPTLPAGYTFKARIGWIRTDSSADKYPLGFTQKGKEVRYKVESGTNVASARSMITGASGTLNSSLTAVAVSSFVPTTAARIMGAIYQKSPGNLTIGVQASPNSTATDAGGAGVFLRQSINTTFANQQVQFDFMLESTNIYYAAAAGGGSSVGMVAFGWVDNL